MFKYYIHKIRIRFNRANEFRHKNIGTKFENFHQLRHKLPSVQVINFGTLNHFTMCRSYSVPKLLVPNIDYPQKWQFRLENDRFEIFRKIIWPIIMMSWWQNKPFPSNLDRIFLQELFSRQLFLKNNCENRDMTDFQGSNFRLKLPFRFSLPIPDRVLRLTIACSSQKATTRYRKRSGKCKKFI